MNPSQPKPQSNLQAAPPPRQNDENDISLVGLLDLVSDHRWLIAAVTVLALMLGAAYAYLSTPIYEANTLIQVEQGGGGALAGVAGGSGGNTLLAIQTPTSAETEILRSRLVVGQVVRDLQLNLRVTPKYIPVVGRWLARHATQPSNPGFLGMPGYVSGNESIKVASFDVPAALEGQRFSVVLTTRGYDLLSQTGAILGKGTMGQPLDFTMGGQHGALLVISAVGKPGATFYVDRLSWLGETQALQNNLKLEEPGQGSGVIRASLQGDDPARIARVLNEIGSLYVRQNVERKSAEAEKTLGFLHTYLPQLRKQLEAAEEKYTQFRNRNGTFDLSAEAAATLNQAVGLEGNLLQLQQKRQELAALFTPLHPRVQTIDAQIKRISGEIAALNVRVKTFPDLEQELLNLNRDVKVDSELYVTLLNASAQLRLVKAGKIGNVRIVDPAVVPIGFVKPQRSVVMALALVLGLLAGLALAWVRNSLRYGVKDPTDIERHTGLHVFATLPHSAAQVVHARNAKARIPGSHVLAVAEPQDGAVESLRSLRTALQFAMLDTASKVVLITGPTPLVGKSFTSVNFAAVLGAADKKVMLIDADLRKGHLNQYFGLRRVHGLSEVVSGSVELEDALHRQVAPNVDFLATGTLPPNPAELLMTPALQTLLQQLTSQYDLVIIDTPPVLAASDTAILAPLVGAVFLVARADVSSLGELQESAKRLAQSGAQTRGVIFNDLNLSKRRYGYGAGYKYGRYRYTNYKY